MRIATMTAPAAPEFRAAGTDLSERRRSGVSKGPVVDIAAAGDASISWAADGAATIGAFATIATIATDTRIKGAYPGVSASALSLATPQIRNLATLGGNLAQRARLPEEGWIQLPRPIGQSSLRCGVRSRPLRCAASIDHGGRVHRL